MFLQVVLALVIFMSHAETLNYLFYTIDLTCGIFYQVLQRLYLINLF